MGIDAHKKKGVLTNNNSIKVSENKVFDNFLKREL